MTKIVEMKRFIKYITIFIILSSVFSSCDEWLEATSNTQFPADKLFETKSGFYDALTGVYISMGNEYAYGGAYTWKFNDMVALPYVLVTDNEFSTWQTHLYNNLIAQDEIPVFWQQSYNIIANINMILRELDSHRDVIPDEVEYNLIKGELLALRAYVHFDLLRMFGVSEWSEANATKLTVPYVTVYSKDEEIQRSYADTETLLLSDINTAIDCLSKDPITGNIPDNFNSTINANGYWNNRTKHMNYYATRALLARAYQWKNDLKSAAEEAQAVLTGLFDNDAVEWVDYEAFVTATSDDQRDWTFSTEHIFSLEVTQLQDFISGYLLSVTDNIAIRLTNEVVNELLYPGSDMASATDIRGPRMLLKFGSLGYSCYKLYGSSTYDSNYRNRMPMIKIPEMYYIMAEYHIAQGQNKEALALLDEVRSNRGVSTSFDEEANAEEELMKEYYREFLSEGQMFYYLKHKKLTPKLWSDFSLSEDDLIYPYPQSEIDYGRVQEL